MSSDRKRFPKFFEEIMKSQFEHLAEDFKQIFLDWFYREYKFQKSETCKETDRHLILSLIYEEFLEQNPGNISFKEEIKLTAVLSADTWTKQLEIPFKDPAEAQPPGKPAENGTAPADQQQKMYLLHSNADKPKILVVWIRKSSTSAYLAELNFGVLVSKQQGILKLASNLVVMNNRGDILLKWGFQKAAASDQNSSQMEADNLNPVYLESAVVYFRNGDLYSGPPSAMEPGSFFALINLADKQKADELATTIRNVLDAEPALQGDFSKFSPADREVNRRSLAASQNVAQLLQSLSSPLGYIQFANGRSYCGGFKYGKFCGYGILKTPGFLGAPAVYKEGIWENGMFLKEAK